MKVYELAIGLVVEMSTGYVVKNVLKNVMPEVNGWGKLATIIGTSAIAAVISTKASAQVISDIEACVDAIKTAKKANESQKEVDSGDESLSV